MLTTAFTVFNFLTYGEFFGAIFVLDGIFVALIAPEMVSTALEEGFFKFSALSAFGVIAAIAMTPLHAREREGIFLMLGIIAIFGFVAMLFIISRWPKVGSTKKLQCDSVLASRPSKPTARG